MFITLHDNRSGDPIVVNPNFISRISISPQQVTIVEMHNNQYGSWVRETVAEVMEIIGKSVDNRPSDNVLID